MRPSGSRGDRAVIWLRCGSFFIGLGGKIVHITDAPNSDVHFSEMQAAAAPKREDVATWFDLLDVDDFVTFGGKA